MRKSLTMSKIQEKTLLSILLIIKTFLLESIRLGAIHVSLAEEYETIVENGITLMDTDYGNGDIEEPEDDSKIAHMEYARKNIKPPRWYAESIVNNIVEKNK